MKIKNVIKGTGALACTFYVVGKMRDLSDHYGDLAVEAETTVGFALLSAASCMYAMSAGVVGTNVLIESIALYTKE